MEDNDGNQFFEIYSTVCEMAVYTAAPGETYNWLNANIIVTDYDGDDTTISGLESSLTDCNDYN